MCDSLMWDRQPLNLDHTNTDTLKRYAIGLAIEELVLFTEISCLSDIDKRLTFLDKALKYKPELRLTYQQTLTC
ncbi:hypothetical protein COF80_11390 [Bacillus toyonensis]|nr:hypothetical protein CN586_21615 [Bacillus toyonensis]PEM42534.1 hypothetical protein CN636_20185 [Bacillus toyonensis]PHE86683.1 hypothetical protein COF80_11390 [Bacillus toyonensis]